MSNIIRLTHQAVSCMELSARSKLTATEWVLQPVGSWDRSGCWTGGFLLKEFCIAAHESAHSCRPSYDGKSKNKGICVLDSSFTVKVIHALWQGTPVAKDCQVFKLTAMRNVEEPLMLTPEMSKDLGQLGTKMPGTSEWWLSRKYKNLNLPQRDVNHHEGLSHYGM